MNIVSLEYNCTRIGWIYQILEPKSNWSYIGYTTNISSCKYKHKMNVFNGIQGLLYEFIRNNGGWIAFTFRILDEVKFVNIQELKNRWLHYINIHNPKLNDNVNTSSISTVNIISDSNKCIHDTLLTKCKVCKWNSKCRHDLTMKTCNICTNEKQLCPHNKTKRSCKKCNTDKICIHDKFKYRCFYCKD